MSATPTPADFAANGEELQKFTAPIVCEISNDGKTYTLAKGFYYYRADGQWAQYSSEDGEVIYALERDTIEVPRGFKSDGFTNLGFHRLVQKFGKGLKCAILHDYLYEFGREMGISRKEADEIFLEAMLETKAFWKIKAYFLYFCVRVGAAKHYN